MSKSIKLKDNMYFLGEICDIGTNSYGTYVKYANGLMICYGKFSQNFTQASSTWGGLYEYILNSNVNFPAGFTTQPIITATIGVGAYGGGGFIETVSSSLTQINRIIIARPTVYSSGLFYVNYIAIGSWK